MYVTFYTNLQFGSDIVDLLLTVTPIVTLANVNAPVVATTSWWLHFTAPVVA